MVLSCLFVEWRSYDHSDDFREKSSRAESDFSVRSIDFEFVFTNNGPLLKELERQICAFLNLDSCCFVTNGTLAIQLALRALGITEGEIITTPFSYVATTSAILWERCTPVFVDMDPRTLCIDPNRIEAAVTPKTRAILPVHVFGGACDVAALADISKRYGIPVVYDAAHAFGSELDGKSLLSYGEMATCSFHATKLFHTIEGGCVVSHDPEIQRKLDLLRRFGHNNDEYIQLGINAKANSAHGARESSAGFGNYDLRVLLCCNRTAAGVAGTTNLRRLRTLYIIIRSFGRSGACGEAS